MEILNEVNPQDDQQNSTSSFTQQSVDTQIKLKIVKTQAKVLQGLITSNHDHLEFWVETKGILNDVLYIFQWNDKNKMPQSEVV